MTTTSGLALARVGLLASVRSVTEAAAAAPYADVIDAKEPAFGALGAVDPAILSAIVRCVAGRAAVSATCGDLPFDPAVLGPAMREVSACGVDYVKLGIFGAPTRAALDDVLPALPILQAGAGAHHAPRRIAVLMADQGGLECALEPFAKAGFDGVMLDTAGKTGVGLTALVPAAGLLQFLSKARQLGLLTGLAGALSVSDIPALIGLPGLSYLGFRGALCESGQRGASLSLARLQSLHTVFQAAQPAAAVNARAN